jgi:hypothetical protein
MVNRSAPTRYVDVMVPFLKSEAVSSFSIFLKMWQEHCLSLRRRWESSLLPGWEAHPLTSAAHQDSRSSLGSTPRRRGRLLLVIGWPLSPRLPASAPGRLAQPRSPQPRANVPCSAVICLVGKAGDGWKDGFSRSASMKKQSLSLVLLLAPFSPMDLPGLNLQPGIGVQAAI